MTVFNAGAFSLLGPINEAFQTSALSYGLAGDLGAPKNIGEEYRWNVPVLYYAFDETFVDYFGSNGVAAVDEGFATFNILPPTSAMSPDLAEFPLEVTRVNFRAEALQLLDIKSWIMEIIAEEVGLAEPDRWTWCLRSLAGCPNFTNSAVIKRNFDPETWNPSSYVNGTLYTYRIVCFPAAADAVEVALDPLSLQFTSVAAQGSTFGTFLTGWTRDDMGGLRYLLTTNSLPNIESIPADVDQIVTNAAAELLTTFNLAELSGLSPTNDSAALLALYPGLIITGTTNIFTNIFITNFTAYFTNYPTDPYGTPASVAFITNVTSFIGTVYYHSFGNIVTNHYYTNSLYSIQTTMTTNYPGSVYGSPPSTNTMTVSFMTNLISGDFYIIPQGSNACGISFVNPLATNVIIITNATTVATNDPLILVTNAGVFIQNQLTYFTNYTFVVKRILCPQGGVAARRGMEKLTFVRRDFDSLLGQLYEPVTNTFTHREVANNTETIRTYRRIVEAPDLLISAQDLGLVSLLRTAPNYTRSTAYPGLAGPGIFEPGLQVTFNKVGPLYLNSGPAFNTETDAFLNFQWGSYDGSTNEPVVYPNTQSILNLNNILLMQVANPSLTTGQVGSGYSYTLLGSGGIAPYTWALVPSPFGLPSGLPPGLNLSSGGEITGTPTQSGTFDFIVRMTETNARFIERPLTIIVNP